MNGPQFILTGAMVEHLMLIRDDALLGRALSSLFHHKVQGEDLVCKPEDFKEMGFIIALLKNDLTKAEGDRRRMRTVREQMANGSRTVQNGSRTVQNGSEQPPSPQEKEISPHTPYIEREYISPLPHHKSACACKGAGNVDNSVDNSDGDSKTTKRFVKPSVADVVAFCKEHNYTMINAENFVAYYESNGWKVGRNPMKDWRATIRYWETRRKQEHGTRQPRATANANADITAISTDNAVIF